MLGYTSIDIHVPCLHLGHASQPDHRGERGGLRETNRTPPNLPARSPLRSPGRWYPLCTTVLCSFTCLVRSLSDSRFDKVETRCVESFGSVRPNSQDAGMTQGLRVSVDDHSLVDGHSCDVNPVLVSAPKAGPWLRGGICLDLYSKGSQRPPSDYYLRRRGLCRAGNPHRTLWPRGFSMCWKWYDSGRFI